MCLVEIEGIPKLQTACSTPIRDGMVVYTQTDRVHEAQESVVEFLLVNHPLDCPVCDKGGECPLQDVSMGWGPGKNRMSDPKRHFQKPLPLSPLVRIDRERCILCYRCVRFSQEVSEDDQLQLLERGDRTFVGTFDERPYIAPFHGNITELCPVGALTSETYRFRARPWDIEDAGSICTLCPSQCNVKFTVRDERVARVLARDNAEVDDGWLCDKGRYGFQMMSAPDRITEPMIRVGGRLQPVDWQGAIDAAADGLRKAGAKSAAIVGGRTSNEEGYLSQRIIRGALGSAHVDSRGGGAVDRRLMLELSRPELSVPISATRRGRRDPRPRHRPAALDADPRPADPQGRAPQRRQARGRHRAPDRARRRCSRGRPLRARRTRSSCSRRSPAASSGGAAPKAREEALGRASVIRDADNVVVVYGERCATPELLALAEALGIAGKDGSGLLEVPEEANARGLREVGCVSNAGPGLGEAKRGRAAAGICEGLSEGELSSLLLLNSDPVRDYPNGDLWAEALQAADFVVSVAMFEDDSTKFADVVLPAETHAEKEGTVTHPDGRLQRLRPNVPHPGGVKPGWEVLLELSARLGDELGYQTSAEVLEAIAGEVAVLLRDHRGRDRRDRDPLARAGRGDISEGRAGGLLSGEGQGPAPRVRRRRVTGASLQS